MLVVVSGRLLGSESSAIELELRIAVSSALGASVIPERPEKSSNGPYGARIDLILIFFTNRTC